MITSSESESSTKNVLGSDSICVEVPTDDIRVGDSVLVLPGETIPVDVSILILTFHFLNAHFTLFLIFYLTLFVILRVNDVSHRS